MFWFFCTYPYGLTFNGWHALLCIANNRHGITITTHAVKRDYLIWMTTVRQPTKRWRSYVLTLKYTFICVYWWTRQRIHNTLIVVDRYLRLMGNKTIPDSAEPRLESFYPPFVAGIDLPRQGVLDSYNVTPSYSTWIFCRGVSGFATDCPCGVWCRGLTTCLLHVGPPFGNRILNNSWAVGLT